MNSLPFVSVVMPVYNAEQYLNEAIDSILLQSYSNFELIIINDGSTDKSRDIISVYQDKRIKLLNNDQNQGIVYSLNRGIENSRGKYIVRMDSDDISYPERIEKQVCFMEAHADIGICAGLTETFGAYIERSSLPLRNPEEVKCSLLFDTAIAHPTVIMRAELLNKHHLRYQNYIAEDYIMWVSALGHCKLSVLPEVILKYRVTGNNLTAMLNKKETLKRETYLKAYDIMLRRCGMEASVDDRTLQYYFDSGRLEGKDVGALIKHLKRVLEANVKSRYFDDRVLKDIIGKRWIAYIRRNRQYKFLLSVFTMYGIRYILSRKTSIY